MDAIQQVAVKAGDIHRRAHRLVPGRQRDRDLHGTRDAAAELGQKRPRAATVAVVEKIEGFFGFNHPLIGAPAGDGRAGHRPADDALELQQAALNLQRQPFLRPDAAPRLPAVVVPGMQADFMRFGGGADHRFVPCADAAPRPGGAGQQNIPAVQRGGSGTQHLPQKLRFYQAPQVAPHIVRPDAEEEACLDPMPAQQLQQPRNAVPRAAKGIDIYA